MKTLWICTALGLSAALHVAGAALTKPSAASVLEGGTVAGELALGIGFDDLVKATAGAKSQPVVPKPTQMAAATSRLTPVEAKPMPAQLSATSAQAAIAPVQRLKAVEPPKAEPVKAEPPQPKPVPREKPKPKSEPATAQRGNAAVNTRKGQAQGTQAGTQAEVTKGARESTTKIAGDGAIKSYQSKVLRRIARVPKRAAGARGKALVGITIAASGQIANARIVKSSGHAGIDKVALAQIKRAGPFTPTPTGKSLNVVVRFDSKS